MRLVSWTLELLEWHRMPRAYRVTLVALLLIHLLTVAVAVSLTWEVAP